MTWKNSGTMHFLPFEGWEYILPILFGICLNVFIMLFFTGRLEDILIKCLEYLEALKWKIKRKMKRH